MAWSFKHHPLTLRSPSNPSRANYCTISGAIHGTATIKFKKARNKNESRAERESDSRRPSERIIEECGSHGGNIPPLLAAYLRIRGNIPPNDTYLSHNVPPSIHNSLQPPSNGKIVNYEDLKAKFRSHFSQLEKIHKDTSGGIPRTIMVGGKPFNTENNLNEYKHIEPVKQKKCGLAPERNEAACKEVDDLTMAGIL
nr:hypothetical protein [Tanacetum cinerariifolium]